MWPLIGMVMELTCMASAAFADSQTAFESALTDHFVARGTNRQSASHQSFPMFCRFAGTEIEPHRWRVAGRCASRGVSGRVTLLVKAMERGRYALDVRVPLARLFGFAVDHRYFGVVTGNRATFDGSFNFAGEVYRSRFTIAFSDAGIEHIEESVIPASGGRRVRLVDLTIRPQPAAP